MTRPERDRIRLLLDARRRELTQTRDPWYPRLPGSRVRPPLTFHVPVRRAA